MKIVFFGDSITDMNRSWQHPEHPAFTYGVGYPNFVAGELLYENPKKYEIINRGISGHRVVDLYARIKMDVWNYEPDVLSILVGVNDVWHKLIHNNGVEIERWERIYRMMIEDTLAQLPNIKIIICEPFILNGKETNGEDRWEKLLEVKEYAKVAKKIATDYHLPFVSLQEQFDKMSSVYGVEPYLYDGVHPAPAGAKFIANEWLKVFKEEVDL